MSIWKIKIDKEYIYGHSWDDVEYVTPRDYIITQNCQSFILRFLPSIERSLGECPQWLYNGLKSKSISYLIWIINNTKSPLCFYDIINQSMRKKQQKKCLRDVTISPKQLMSLLVYAGSQGYTLSHYSYFEKIKSQNKDDLTYAFKLQNGEIIANATNMTDKEIKYHLENDELINAFILDKGDKWFCLCQRKRGILGKEPNKRGSVPHMHFISNAFGRKREDLVNEIRKGKCPDSSIHITITDYI